MLLEELALRGDPMQRPYFPLELTEVLIDDRSHDDHYRGGLDNNCGCEGPSPSLTDLITFAIVRHCNERNLDKCDQWSSPDHDILEDEEEHEEQEEEEAPQQSSSVSRSSRLYLEDFLAGLPQPLHSSIIDRAFHYAVTRVCTDNDLLKHYRYEHYSLEYERRLRNRCPIDQHNWYVGRTIERLVDTVLVRIFRHSMTYGGLDRIRAYLFDEQLVPATTVCTVYRLQNIECLYAASSSENWHAFVYDIFGGQRCLPVWCDYYSAVAAGGGLLHGCNDDDCDRSSKSKSKSDDNHQWYYIRRRPRVHESSFADQLIAFIRDNYAPMIAALFRHGSVAEASRIWWPWLYEARRQQRSYRRRMADAYMAYSNRPYHLPPRSAIAYDSVLPWYVTNEIGDSAIRATLNGYGYDDASSREQENVSFRADFHLDENRIRQALSTVPPSLVMRSLRSHGFVGGLRRIAYDRTRSPLLRDTVSWCRSCYEKYAPADASATVTPARGDGDDDEDDYDYFILDDTTITCPEQICRALSALVTHRTFYTCYRCNRQLVWLQREQQAATDA